MEDLISTVCRGPFFCIMIKSDLLSLLPPITRSIDYGLSSSLYHLCHHLHTRMPADTLSFAPYALGASPLPSGVVEAGRYGRR